MKEKLFFIILLFIASITSAQYTFTKQWDKTLGGISEDVLYSVQPTNDGGCILGGGTLSGLSGDKTQASWGGYDYWVVKIDANGNKLWDKRYGGAGQEGFYTMMQTRDGGSILGGTSSGGN